MPTGATPPIVTAEGLGIRYARRDRPALDDVSAVLHRGESVAVTGPSGCGKTTLLSMLAGLSWPDTGRLTYRFPGQPPASRLTPALRRHHVGLVFQGVHLIPTLSVIENVEIPLFGVVASAAERTARARAMLDRLGLADAAHWRPQELSGGERQRVAVARAFVNRPVLILADEPTGNLDSRSAEIVVQALLEQSAETGGTLVMVTHNTALAARLDRQIALLDGRLVQPENAG